eukprot:scaffold50837_cov24-Tisochrysis_lutea.AAC.2
MLADDLARRVAERPGGGVAGTAAGRRRTSNEDMCMSEGIAASGGTAGVADICLLMLTGTGMLNRCGARSASVPEWAPARRRPLKWARGQSACRRSRPAALPHHS